MLDTERSPQQAARLQAEIMRERAEELYEAKLGTKDRLVAQEEALVRLRVQIAMLKASLTPPPVVRSAPVVRAVPVVVAPIAPIPVLEKEAVLDSASFTTASLPRSASWRRAAPYAAILACAAFLEFGGARRPASAAPDFASLVRPAPAPVMNARPAANGSPVVAVDDDRSQEALLLVHEWKLPGDEQSLGERLGGELELPGGRPTWNVERTGAHGYLVTFQADSKDLPYSFEADIEARVVWPTPETQELLAPRFTAAFRDSVR